MFQPEPPRAPLGGIRVLDLGRYQAAPRCAVTLGRLGAEVIKVEPPAGDESRSVGPFADGTSIYWAHHNAGKRSLAVDLRTADGKRLLERLVQVSDVLIENFRTGVFEEMGFAYERLRGLNPRLIVVHVSGFGRSRAMGARPAFDQVGQAMSGYMSLNGDPAGPPTISPFPLVDRLTALHATIATLAALLERAVSGLGQEIEVTLADAAYSTVELPLAAYIATGEVPVRMGNATALGNMFQARDGYVYVADYSGDRVFGRLARAVGHDEWSGDARFIDRKARIANSGVIEAALVPWFEDRGAREAALFLGNAGVPCSPVNAIPSAAREPWFLERQPFGDTGQPGSGEGTHEVVPAPGLPFRFGRSSRPAPAHTPAVGEHTAYILKDVLGLEDATIADLKSRGVIHWSTGLGKPRGERPRERP
jgi:CoA:oxalate CoA-transferase